MWPLKPKGNKRNSLTPSGCNVALPELLTHSPHGWGLHSWAPKKERPAIAQPQQRIKSNMVPRAETLRCSPLCPSPPAVWLSDTIIDTNLHSCKSLDADVQIFVREMPRCRHVADMYVHMSRDIFASHISFLVLVVKMSRHGDMSQCLWYVSTHTNLYHWSYRVLISGKPPRRANRGHQTIHVYYQLYKVFSIAKRQQVNVVNRSPALI